ncbi:MAG: sigma-70 family RNA polymerase sigma factor [Candidatus Dadabacteria bacterium]|nr:sigma-70 family RNA polymerase sigma factor [Candidatus Dadabacteria bacterium]NIT13062.1 sigma-70 family RNA polymerase sigma factor [Candidatus Dadabacteria bacterium]
MESDIDLILRVQNGDDTAFSEILRRYYNRILNYVYRYTNNRETSEDLTQEIFMRVHRSVKNYRPEAKFSTWLYKIATNLCLTEVATRARKHTSSLDEIQENLGSLEDEKSLDQADVRYRKEIKEIIFEAMNNLSENERSAIMLCKYEQLSYEEVAQTLDCTVGAVKTYVYRGRMKLIEKLKPYLDEVEMDEM